MVTLDNNEKLKYVMIRNQKALRAIHIKAKAEDRNLANAASRLIIEGFNSIVNDKIRPVDSAKESHNWPGVRRYE